jgi:hypothetical protein
MNLTLEGAYAQIKTLENTGGPKAVKIISDTELRQRLAAAKASRSVQASNPYWLLAARRDVAVWLESSASSAARRFSSC